MSISIKRMDNLHERAILLGCNLPSGVSVFPRNFDSVTTLEELEFDDSAQMLRKLFREAGVKEEGIVSTRPRYLQQRDNVPAICLFVSWTIASQDPASLQVALNVVSNYLSDLFKGIRRVDDQKCQVKVVRQHVKGKENNFEEITYEGPVSGLSKLFNQVTDVSN